MSHYLSIFYLNISLIAVAIVILMVEVSSSMICMSIASCLSKGPSIHNHPSIYISNNKNHTIQMSNNRPVYIVIDKMVICILAYLWLLTSFLLTTYTIRCFKILKGNQLFIVLSFSCTDVRAFLSFKVAALLKKIKKHVLYTL